jgi:predicted RNase H-like HicB family nuclease
LDVNREVSLTAVYEPVENGWVQARIREMPGVITAAPTRAEAEDMLLDALREFLLSFRSDSDGDETGSGHDVSPVHIVLSA